MNFESLTILPTKPGNRNILPRSHSIPASSVPSPETQGLEKAVS